MRRRDRLSYFILGCLVVAVGLASRRYAAVLPVFLAEYAGDTLWALMVFLGIGMLAPRWSSFCVAVVALVVSYSVEVSQLYHASWIDSLRDTRVGGLVLGFGFLWSDIACYTVGIAIGVMLETLARRPHEG
jgi:VanZ family protein